MSTLARQTKGDNPMSILMFPENIINKVKFKVLHSKGDNPMSILMFPEIIINKTKFKVYSDAQVLEIIAFKGG